MQTISQFWVSMLPDLIKGGIQACFNALAVFFAMRLATKVVLPNKDKKEEK